METKTQSELQFDDRAQDALRQYSAPDFELLDAASHTAVHNKTEPFCVESINTYCPVS